MALAVVRRVTTRIRRLLAEPVETASRSNPRLEVAGRLCLGGAENFRRRLFNMLRVEHAAERALALVLSGVRFMDGSALAVLVEFAQACVRRGISLRLIEPSEQVWDAFQLYGLTEMLIEFSEFENSGLEGVLVVIEEDFPEAIHLPAAA